MKTICLPRCSGKTTRLMYESEFSGVPILCAAQMSKDYIKDKAKELKLDIPEPILLSEVLEGKFKDSVKKDALVDNAEIILQSLLSDYGLKIKAMTVTNDKITQKLLSE